MKSFKCVLQGENFPLGDNFALLGFFVTRFVVAADSNAAELSAIQMLRDEGKLTMPAGYKPTGIARVFVDEIEEVEPDQVPPRQPGFHFFQMGSES